MILFSFQADGKELVHSYESSSDYLQKMRKDGTWGDHLILQAAADCYKRPIKVISSVPHSEEPLIIKPVSISDEDNVDPLVLGHVPEVHYVSLLPGNLT